MIFIWAVYAFALGLCFGSFGNVLIYRLPTKKSILVPSSCPSCGRRLNAADLIPVISWVALGGRCRTCKVKISSRYCFVELLCGALFMGMVVFNFSLSAIPLALLAFALLCVAMIDWDTQEIPDSLLIFATIIGIAYIAFPFFTESPNWLEALMGVAVGFIPLYAADKVSLFILKKDGFGYGDMKLMAVVGMFLGWQLILTAFYLAFITGSLYAIYLLLTKRIQKGGYFAFGPFLCLGILLAIWFGASINEWFATLYLAGW